MYFVTNLTMNKQFNRTLLGVVLYVYLICISWQFIDITGFNCLFMFFVIMALILTMFVLNEDLRLEIPEKEPLQWFSAIFMWSVGMLLVEAYFSYDWRHLMYWPNCLIFIGFLIIYHIIKTEKIQFKKNSTTMICLFGFVIAIMVNVIYNYSISPYVCMSECETCVFSIKWNIM